MDNTQVLRQVGLSTSIQYIATQTDVTAYCNKCHDFIVVSTNASRDSEDTVVFLTFPIKHIGSCGVPGEYPYVNS